MTISGKNEAIRTHARTHARKIFTRSYTHVTGRTGRHKEIHRYGGEMVLNQTYCSRRPKPGHIYDIIFGTGGYYTRTRKQAPTLPASHHARHRKIKPLFYGPGVAKKKPGYH